MTTMVERVARAMFQLRYPNIKDRADWVIDAGPTVLRGKPSWFELVPEAQVVISTMRDVDGGSPAILAAGKKSLYSCSPDPELEDARHCWEAMIDAALSEK